jgi:hypothetical protein
LHVAQLGTNVVGMGNIDQATAEVVRSAIWRAKLTQKAVFEAIHMHPRTWHRKASGERSFHVSELVDIAKQVGRNAGELLDEAVEKTS